jgi:hypothetical protein
MARQPASDSFQPDSFTPDTPAPAAQDSFVADSFTPDAPETGTQKLLRYAGALGKGLDYLGGTLRTTAATDLSQIPGMPKLADKKEVIKGLEFGGFPGTDKFLERGGVPQLGTLSGALSHVPVADQWFEDPKPGEPDSWLHPNKGGILDITGRGALGFLGDTLTDPLTYATFGGAPAAKAGTRAAEALAKEAGQTAVGAAAREAAQSVGKAASRVIPAQVPEAIANTLRKAARAPTNALRSVGDKLYESGLGPLIKKGEKTGKDVAESYYRQGINTVGDIGDKVRAAAARLKLSRDATLRAADAAGGEASRATMFQPVVDQLDQLVRDRRMTEEQATKIYLDLVDQYGRGGEPSLSLATQWKTDTRAGLPGNYWQQFKPSNPDLANRLEALTGDSMQRTVERGVSDKLGSQAGERFAQENKDLGTMLDTMNTAHDFGHSARKVKMMDPIDWLLLSGEVYSNGAGRGIPYGLKKTLDVARNPRAQLPTGYWLKRWADAPLTGPATDILMRNALTRPQHADDEENKK